MNLSNKTALHLRKLVGVASLVAFSSVSFAGIFPSLVDDFSDVKANNLGVARQFMNDTVMGGKTHTDIEVAKGKLHVKGDIVPPRGQPGWASSILLLDPKGLPQNLSQYKGVRLLMKVNKGSLSVSVNSADVTNFDYHAAQILVKPDGKFHEVNIAFDSMKRAWSEQTPLNVKAVTGLSISAFGIQKASFDFKVDEVSFY